MPRRALAALLLVLPAPAVLASPAAANTAGTGLVISEVYGGGGSTSTTTIPAYNRDFVELYNPTDLPVDVSTMSVQYRSSGGTGNPSGVTPLSGSVPAHGHLLVGEGTATGATGAALPTPDVSGSISMSATAGTVFLANQQTPLTTPATGSHVNDPAVLDVVGFGSTNTYEGTPAPAPSTTTSVARSATGTDTDNNGVDLVAGAPTPTPAGPTEPPPPPTPAPHTIEEIQGTGATSPLAGQSVTTEGVVTAAYPTGGFNGFYLQAPGTGGDVDLPTHQASDGVFVFSSAAAQSVHVGDHVQVTGTVSEFNGLTEVAPASGGVSVLASPVEAVKPATVAWPLTEAQRESLEGMLVAPQGAFTVADNYSLNQYAEIGLASGDHPLWQPTEVADPHDAAAIAAVNADNAARRVTLDDGATTNFLSSANKGIPLPWLTQDHQIRVGAPARFTAPLVLDYRNSLWKLEPTGQLTASGEPPVSFGHDRTSAPAPVGGDVRIASFNVLNYFPTTGADWVAAGGSCTWYDDRDGNHVTVNTCTGPNGEPGPRGAADDDDLARQQAKIVAAINGLGADVVSLEEIENSAKFGTDRDDAVRRLVAALNDASTAAGTWAYVPTPATIGDQADEDVIRTAFIYRTAVVEPVGPSYVDDVPAFDNARDPLAQAFEPVGGTSATRFAVVVNHFKSKGSGPDDGTGQGLSNAERVAQAHALVDFAEQVKASARTQKVFLSGDFNSYTREDPIEVLRAAGYTDVGQARAPQEHTYLFDGVVGSLDHVLANGPALAAVTGAHVWNINSVEPIALEYSRFNYNATDFYEPSPYRASDHDPLLVGVSTAADPVPTTTTASVSPDPVPVAKKAPIGSVDVRVTSPEDVVTAGTVEVYDGAQLVGSASVADGASSIPLPAYRKKGTYALTVRYLGTAAFAPSATTVTFRVSNK